MLKLYYSLNRMFRIPTGVLYTPYFFLKIVFVRSRTEFAFFDWVGIILSRKFFRALRHVSS